MQSFFNGMSPFQIILAAMGVLVLLVLLFILIWNVIKQRAVTSFLPFFIIPVIMVGYPSIKSIQFFNAILSMNEEAAVVNNNVQDSTARASLETKVATLKSDVRSQSSGSALASIARAQIALGEYDSAEIYLKRAEHITPSSVETTGIRNTLDSVKQEHQLFSQKINSLNRLLTLLKDNNTDPNIFRALNSQLEHIDVPTYVQADQMRVLARSYAVIGNQEISLKAMDKVATDTKSSPTDHALLDSIRRRKVQDAYLTTVEKTTINAQPQLKPAIRLDRTIVKPR